MASDTGAPWLLPYPEDTDLVRDGASDIEALAVATAAGLSSASGLVEVKTVVFTGTQSQSIGAGASYAVTNLSITHTVENAANRVILIATVNGASAIQAFAAAIRAGGTFIGVGDADGTRTRIGGGNTPRSDDFMASVTAVAVHTPGGSAVTYEAHAFNLRASAATVVVNRSISDSDSEISGRAASTLTLMEVKV
jgi:hypothetical protein